MLYKGLIKRIFLLNELSDQLYDLLMNGIIQYSYLFQTNESNKIDINNILIICIIIRRWAKFTYTPLDSFQNIKETRNHIESIEYNGHGIGSTLIFLKYQKLFALCTIDAYVYQSTL